MVLGSFILFCLLPRVFLKQLSFTEKTICGSIFQKKVSLAKLSCAQRDLDVLIKKTGP